MLKNSQQQYLIRLFDENGIQKRFIVQAGEAGKLISLRFDIDLPSDLTTLIGVYIQELRRSTKPVFTINVGNAKAGLIPVTRVIVEAVKDRLRLIVFGAGHVGRAIAQLGTFVGYKVVLVDDRRDFLDVDRVSDNADDSIEYIHKEFNIAARSVDISRDSAVVIVTRGHQFDEECLKSVIGSDATYIGMIGSRRRVLSIFRRLRVEGVTEEKLSRVFAPIGLKIGAVTPHEIAVSILAEVIAVENGSASGDICHLKV